MDLAFTSVMLRIASSARNGTTEVRLEGSLVGPWVDECRAALARETSEGQRLAIDVSEVRFADSRGTELLRELDGAGFVTRSSGYTAELIRRGDSMKIEKDGRRSLGADMGTASLVARIRAGQAGAREELVRHHGGAMLETARRLLSCEAEAVEVLKQAFQTAFRSPEACAGDRELGDWLHGIVVDRCLERLRSRVSRAEPLDGLLPVFDAVGQHAAPVEPWTSQRLPPGELGEVVRRHIDSLPISHRVVLLLCDAEGLSTREAAERLALPHIEAAARLHRARQALRSLLAGAFTPRSAG